MKRRTRKLQKGRGMEDVFSKYPSLKYFLFETADQRATYTSMDQLKTIPNIIQLHRRALDMLEGSVEKYLKKQYTIVLVEGEKILCSGIFYFRKVGGSLVAHLQKIECELKTNTYKPISFVLMYFVVSIVEWKKVDFIDLTVMAIGDHWKLYSLYHDMGFACITNTNTMTKNAYETKLYENTDYFKENISQVAAKDFKTRCGTMFAYVPTVMKSLETILLKD